jgi:GNAT superfamily N-acetyltransferase
MTARAVRLATAADLDDVLALIHGAASWLHSRGLDQWPHESPTLSAGAISRHIAAGHTWLAFEDGRAVATIAADPDGDTDFWEPWQLETPSWYVSKLATSRTARKGTGAMLLRWAVDRAGREGIVMVRLDVWRTNQRLQDWYREQGWTYRGTVELPWRKSGALFERPAAPDIEAREFWEPDLAPGHRPMWLARTLRGPLEPGTEVVTADGRRGTIEVTEPVSASQPEVGALPDYPQALAWVRIGAELEPHADADLDRAGGDA